jgi:hypothetical protein
MPRMYRIALRDPQIPPETITQVRRNVSRMHWNAPRDPQIPLAKKTHVLRNVS